MSQHDLTIDNQGFPAFRLDLNNALQALGTMQAGATAPTTTFANMLWYDTANSLLKVRNAADTAWITLPLVLTADNTVDIDAGTISLSSETDALGLPAGSTAQRPTPVTGMFRYNTDNQAFEGYDGSSWGSVGGASGGGGNPFIYLNDQTVTVDYSIPADKNGMTAGPITIDSGITVTVPTGSVWTIV